MGTTIPPPLRGTSLYTREAFGWYKPLINVPQGGTPQPARMGRFHPAKPDFIQGHGPWISPTLAWISPKKTPLRVSFLPVYGRERKENL